MACAGARTGLSFSLNYAAPETVAAHESGARTIVADAAADVWALGVLAYELLAQRRVFPVTTSAQAVRDALSGRAPLPWETREPAALRTLKRSVLACLCRDAAARPAAADVVATWRNLLDFAAVQHTVVTTASDEEHSDRSSPGGGSGA